MNVILLGNYPHDGNESMDRYAGMLQGLLTEAGCQVQIIRPEPFFGRLKPSGEGLGKWLGYIDKYLLFPSRLRALVRRQKKKSASPDAFIVHICDQANAVYTRWLQDVPHLVTCHDVFAIQAARGKIPGRKTGWTGRILQRWILSGLKRAAYVVCVTEETRADLISLAPGLAERSSAIESPLNYPYTPLPKTEAIAQLLPLGLGARFQPGNDPFLFHVGGNQWYKNREGVIRIYAALCNDHPEWIRRHPLKLVMAGKSPTTEMLKLAEERGLMESVIFVTSVSNQQLCAFYSLAEALVYPSFKEGFGWPIIEAQACSCPVVTSSRPPMSRLAGPAAVVGDPEDISDFSERLFHVLSETPESRHDRKADALQHARTFDPEVFAQKIKLTYETLLTSKR